MRTIASVLVAVALGLASPAAAQLCPGCIHNQAAPENAQINIGTATIRGTSTLNVVTANSVTAGSVSATTLTGNDSAITSLSASQLLSGVVAAARVVGNYTGITGLGTIVSGVWNGSLIGTQYGGTGQNWSAVAAGSLPFFNSTGSMSTVAPSTAGKLLQTNGAASPTWTAAPSVLGTNVTSIPPTNLQAGTLPASVAVGDASLTSVSASKVVGNIAGSAASLSVPLPIGNLAPGQLPTSNPASSITVTGVLPGTYGGPTQMAQFHVNSDGRVDSASQFLLSVPPPIITPGVLPGGILIDPSAISTGALANYVIASSIAASGVTPGTYGDATRTITQVVGVDGRLTAVGQQLIAIPPSQLLAGALPGSVTVPAASISAGSLAGGVVASSLTNSGVTPGTYGGLTQIPQVTVGLDGRVTSASQFLLPALSTSTVASDVDNNWSHSQTFLGVSSITLQSGNLSANQITAALLFGNGAGITNISPFVISSGTLPVDVVASSVGVNTISDPQVAVGANIAQSKIANLASSFAAKASSGTNNDITDLDALVTATATGQIEAGGFFTPGASTAAYFYGDGSNLTGLGGSGPCESSGAANVLCQGTGNTIANSTSSTISGGEANTIIGGTYGYEYLGGGLNNTISGGDWDTLVGGRLNTVTSGNYNSMLGGQSNTLSANTGNNVLVGGYNNTMTNSGGSGAMFLGGGSGNQIVTAGGTGTLIVGGVSNVVNYGDHNVIVGGLSNTIPAGYKGVIVGGKSNVLGGGWEANFGFIGGGEGNAIDPTTAPAPHAVLVGGHNNVNRASLSVLVGGDQNSIASGGLDNAIVGGHTNSVSGSAYNFIGGGDTNVISSGGNYNTISGGINNTISGIQAGITVAGGSGNTASGNISTVGGGTNNNNSGHSGTIGGGNGNVNTAQYATVSGGRTNSNDNEYGVIAGGHSNVNTLGAFGAGSVIGGGESNTISNYVNTQGVVIAGGSSNGSGGMGAWSVISGGNQNKAQGAYSVTPGGLLNSAFGDYSYAAGRRAKATAQGSFVMADSQDSDLLGATTDQLLLRFQGGVEVQTSSLNVTGDAYFSVDTSTQASAGAGALTTVSCAAGKYALSGGCSCTGGTALDSTINTPYPTLTAGGAMPTGWQCQATGTVGASCDAHVVCSRITKP